MQRQSWLQASWPVKKDICSVHTLGACYVQVVLRYLDLVWRHKYTVCNCRLGALQQQQPGLLLWVRLGCGGGGKLCTATVQQQDCTASREI
jgi:hypothetical protein